VDRYNENGNAIRDDSKTEKNKRGASYLPVFRPTQYSVVCPQQAAVNKIAADNAQKYTPWLTPVRKAEDPD